MDYSPEFSALICILRGMTSLYYSLWAKFKALTFIIKAVYGSGELKNLVFP